MNDLLKHTPEQAHRAGEIPAHGGVLQDLMVTGPDRDELRRLAERLPSKVLNQRMEADVELMMSGALSPLTGFMGREDYDSVCERMRLADGTLFPMPYVLDVSEAEAQGLTAGSIITLRTEEQNILGVLEVSDVWVPDKMREAELVYGTTDEGHPGVFDLMHKTGPVYVGGKILGLDYPPHFMFRELRQTPTEVRQMFKDKGWDTVVAFQTRNPMHRAHVALTMAAMEKTGGSVLIHPTVGPTQPGDLDSFVRVKCYEAVLPYYPEGRATLSVLPLSMRMAGPREALLHAIIRQNFGATHFIIGRDPAGPKHSQTGESFYGPYEAHELIESVRGELAIQVLLFEEMQYVKELDRYVQPHEVPEGATVLSMSGTKLRQALRGGREIEEWFTFEGVAKTLRKEFPPRGEQGVVVWLTGLSGSGKSTIAKRLEPAVRNIIFENGRRGVVTNLDGDRVRQSMSKGVGFDREGRRINVERVGVLAQEIAKQGGIVLCALISPYREDREMVRKMVESNGGAFIEVHVATPLDECKQRDVKGLYAKAERGEIPHFTGISDPYEEPLNPEITIDTTNMTPEAAAQQVVDYLVNEGYLIMHDSVVK